MNLFIFIIIIKIRKRKLSDEADPDQSTLIILKLEWYFEQKQKKVEKRLSTNLIGN